MLTARASRGLTIALAAGLLAGATGCGSSDDNGTSAAATDAPAAATTATDASASTPAGTTARDSSASASKDSAVASTPPGDFALGDKAVLAQQQFIDNTFVDTPLEISVTKVEQGSLSDLKNFKLDAQSKQGTPFYVNATFTNKSDVTFDGTGLAGGLTVLNGAGDESSRLGLIGDFPKCQANPPKSFKPGATAKTCDVYILPKGQSVAQVYSIDRFAAKYVWKVGS